MIFSVQLNVLNWTTEITKAFMIKSSSDMVQNCIWKVFQVLRPILLKSNSNVSCKWWEIERYLYRIHLYIWSITNRLTVIRLLFTHHRLYEINYISINPFTCQQILTESKLVGPLYNLLVCARNSPAPEFAQTPNTLVEHVRCALFLPKPCKFTDKIEIRELICTNHIITHIPYN